MTLAISGSVLFLLAACDSSTGHDGPPSSTTSAPSTLPKVAVSVSPAPTQRNDSGRPLVGFDPCVSVGDDLIAKAGFDPESRERSDMTFDTYSFIGCRFGDKELVNGQKLTVRTLLITASNITLDEFRDRYRDTSTEVVVDGRPALRYDNPDAHREYCNIAIAFDGGVLDLSKGTRGAFTDEDRCDGIQEIAETIESALPQ
ncbi:DUF3558 domain-containing protein [Nocardia cyriacigeorgica]|uniref:DUF3558 domain-containing protein n=1 Tax=Nocardia cyriacigeorgica TaxID=135487 RepID=A0A6P1CRE4_9NOCA|nr:DUF3558 domain-containing protein [Nocardia cyriacigeorgica]MBF6290141.1 DUF3558 domain-containing protein [Nocardia cyriacigeorgica]MBF6424952.1 DUF3558 domain-containing protein [Nocardia cyriacigeorgica]NEW34243.1 DUF3558 domain-containing protein [Nocardia cyriacigeorgica]